MSRRNEVMKQARASLYPGNASFIQRKPFTFADCCVYLDNHLYGGVGFARCNHTDEWDAERGKQIALGRALREVVDKYMAAHP